MPESNGSLLMRDYQSATRSRLYYNSLVSGGLPIFIDTITNILYLIYTTSGQLNTLVIYL